MEISVRLRRACGLTLVALAATACAPSGEEPASPASDPVPEPQFTLPAENTHARWSRTIPPVLTVPSGAVVEVFTQEATGGQLSRESVLDDLTNLDFDRIHALTGPVYVEGAEPGDVLAVTLHEIEVGDWGWAAIVPGFGFLADLFTEPYLKLFELGPGATHAVFNDRIRVPLAPFAGVMGVAPDTDSLLVTIPPRANGGKHGQPPHDCGDHRVLPRLPWRGHCFLSVTPMRPRGTARSRARPLRRPCESSTS